ncbi:hypothetical protein XENOCAPTIV_020156 [Xenoophorus captivus]|uniref:Uncharacterized protein n=1 Tax=Xenoophorus captivus TaxID=1517983 RepID=A0ABV0S0F4_9TELE
MTFLPASPVALYFVHKNTTPAQRGRNEGTGHHSVIKWVQHLSTNIRSPQTPKKEEVTSCSASYKDIQALCHCRLCLPAFINLLFSVAIAILILTNALVG